MKAEAGDAPPLVSIVVPVFDGMPFLVDLVESIVCQTYDHFEVIFGDGGGSDSSMSFLNSMTDSRFKVMPHPVGTSPAATWTAVSEAAVGVFTKVVCQDDLLHPEALALQVRDLLTHPEAVMAVGLRDIVDASGRLVLEGRGLSGITGTVITGDEIIRTAYRQGGNPIGEPVTVLFRTSALKDAMPWDDSNPLMLDLTMYARVVMGQKAVVRRETVGSFRLSQGAWSTRLMRSQAHLIKEWQYAYAASADPPVSRGERIRARWGRWKQVAMRRLLHLRLRLEHRL